MAEWKILPGTNGFYEVSDEAEVRRVSSGRHLKPYMDDHGYLRLKLRRNGVMKHLGIHQAVALAFHGEPIPGMEVRHLDGDKLNNAPDNLRWGTRSENISDQVSHGTHWRSNNPDSHCKRGHALDGANLYNHAGRRHCRQCRSENARIRKVEGKILPHIEKPCRKCGGAKGLGISTAYCTKCREERAA